MPLSLYFLSLFFFFLKVGFKEGFFVFVVLFFFPLLFVGLISPVHCYPSVPTLCFFLVFTEMLIVPFTAAVFSFVFFVDLYPFKLKMQVSFIFLPPVNLIFSFCVNNLKTLP